MPVTKIGTLNKEQEQLMQQLSPYLQSRIGQGLRPWEGDFTAGMSPYEQAGMGKLGQYLEMGTPALETFGLEQYRQGLGGMSPEATEEMYGKYYQPLRQRIWGEEIEPAISEAFVGPGTYFGTDRGRAVARGAQEWGERGMTQMGDVIQAERARSAGLMPYLPQMAGLPGERLKGQAVAGTTTGALPRLLEQQELTATIQDYIRTDPQASPILSYALQLLGTQTQTAFYQPREKEWWEEPLGELIGAGGQMGAAAIAASDIRLKDNVRKVGTTKRGLGVYTWRWKDWVKRIVKNTPTVGVIAQEVMRVVPEAVSIGKHGYLMVNYGLL